MQDNTKYSVVAGELIGLRGIDLNVLQSVWAMRLSTYFMKWLAYLGLILDSGNITSISAVLK